MPVRPIRELPRFVGHLTSVEALPLARLAPPLSEHGRVGALEGNMRDVHEGDEEPQPIQGQRYNAKMDNLLGRVPSRCNGCRINLQNEDVAIPDKEASTDAATTHAFALPKPFTTPL